MVHNNKVLTVSYGTFSCTLEGFDDSFGTMKAIAEYFRDLASDDRYFGAEPPQPDVEMLARIAQREITRQVEAHSTDTGGIVLRAAETAAVAAPVAAVAATPDPAPKPAPEVVPEPTVEPEVAEAEDAFEDIIVADDAAEDDVEEPGSLEDTAAEVIESDAVFDQAPEDDTKIEPALVDMAAEMAAEPVSKPATVPAADSIAAKLQRIRAVVSQNDTLVQMDGYTEDEDADQFVVAAVQDISQSLDTDDDIAADPEDLDSADEVSQVLSQLDDLAEDKTGDGDDAADELFTDDGQVEDSELFGDADTGDMVAEQVEDTAAIADEEFADEPTDEPLVDDTALFNDQDSDDTDLATDDLAGEDATIPQGDAEEEPAEPLADARVLKVKRADLEAAIANGQLEQVDGSGDTDETAEPTATKDGSLSPEDEADLMRELAEVEAELKNASDGDEVADNIFGEDIVSEVGDEVEDKGQQAVARTNLSQTVGKDDADVSRLMDAADEKLGDPETSSRRNTYSQLRGAVAAAEAERTAGGSIGGQEPSDAFRSDLASVVRPRRPALDDGNRASRPAVESRPAPLKLVAEQRVDAGAGIAQRGPVRPRRVMTVPVSETTASDATGADSAFAEFAARMGATELPDLLEAAAAYLSFVEGHDKFSRPQLMNKVRLIQQDGYNREDGLRSFGQLLRDGKIEKRGGGRFAASGEIGFRPDEREAG